ncbi:MAG TPA: type IVB secretion system protein IcmH/DotU [Acetobacteraceae bacterium]|nr:type IVB secretion system protein IcmH/DotU [Acetobacteraceae bacterium]
MSDNPFSEPDDSDRTVIRPAPGGRRAAPAAPAAPPVGMPPSGTPAGGFGAASPFDTPPRQAAPAASPFASSPAAPIPAEGAETIRFGLNPLITAAAPLLQLLGRLRNTYSQPNVNDLRERAIQQMRAFESAARDGGVPMEQLRPAHYALCASVDDVVLNTPWGSSGGWAARSLVSSFHQEVRSGERFFVLLNDVRQNPGTFLPVLELMYLCLSLGFQGQYRLSPRGPGELDRIREDLYTVITRQRAAAADPALSPHWQGVQAPYKPARAAVPTWVMGAGALAVIGGLFVWFSTSLNAASDDVFASMLSAPLSHMPAISRAAPVRPPPPPPVVEPEPLYVFLKPEIDQGLVTVLGDHAMPIVRIRNRGLFPSGSATVAPSYTHLLERIGQALKAEKGPVQVIGYTDNQPIHTVQFPSNFQLSTKRAEAARAIIVRALGDQARVTAEGRADADPIASNATAEGRDQNRRIEVVLRRQG